MKASLHYHLDTILNLVNNEQRDNNPSLALIGLAYRRNLQGFTMPYSIIAYENHKDGGEDPRTGL